MPVDVAMRASQRVTPYERPPDRIGTTIRGVMFVLCVVFLYLWFASPQTLTALFDSIRPARAALPGSPSAPQ